MVISNPGEYAFLMVFLVPKFSIRNFDLRFGGMILHENPRFQTNFWRKRIKNSEYFAP